MCLVVDCLRGEIHQYRESGPPEWPRPGARRPLAQRRSPTAPQKIKAVENHFFIRLCLPNHTNIDQVTTLLRRLIALSASLLAVWGLMAASAHPRHPEGDSLLSDAGKTSLPLAAALRGGSAPLLASLVTNGCFLTLCVIRLYKTNGPSQTRIFLDIYSTECCP